jgi:glutathione S-transferase
MTTQLQPIVLHGDLVSPNPFKVAILLNELSLPFETKPIPRGELKKPAYESINPNGRIPAITDPNTGITVWESGAIIEYLVSEYDHGQHKLSFAPRTPEAYAAVQWLHFQASGQGPYYGQGYWFRNANPEKIPSAVERYVNEIRRVSGVLDRWLDGREYLVGGRVSFADLAFVPWQLLAQGIVGDAFDLATEFPRLQAWLDGLTARPAVADIIRRRSAQGH